jgi:hypothetical protein
MNLHTNNLFVPLILQVVGVAGILAGILARSINKTYIKTIVSTEIKKYIYRYSWVAALVAGITSIFIKYFVIGADDNLIQGVPFGFSELEAMGDNNRPTYFIIMVISNIIFWQCIKEILILVGNKGNIKA